MIVETVAAITGLALLRALTRGLSRSDEESEDSSSDYTDAPADGYSSYDGPDTSASDDGQSTLDGWM